MLSTKYFSKKLFYSTQFKDCDFCFDKCEIFDECEDFENTNDCEYYQLHKRFNPIFIEHPFFSIIRWYSDKNPTILAILDEHRVILITIGKIDYNSVLNCDRYKDFRLRKIKFKDFQYDFREKLFYYKINYYSRNLVYFALKCVQNPEIIISENYLFPLIVRNEYCSIFISPRENIGDEDEE